MSGGWTRRDGGVPYNPDGNFPQRDFSYTGFANISARRRARVAVGSHVPAPARELPDDSRPNAFDDVRQPQVVESLDNGE